MDKLKKCIFIVKLLKQHGKMTRSEINDKISERWLGDPQLSRSSFVRYLNFINENFPYAVKFNNVTGQYSIISKAMEKEDDELFQYLLSMYCVESSAPLLLKHRDRIHNIENTTGTDKLDIILQAIDEKRGIECYYQSFAQSTRKKRTFIPIFITSWEGRWYCIAEVTTHPESAPYTYALERMSDMHLTHEHFTPRYKGSSQDYFKDNYGIQGASPTDKPQDIIIKAFGAQAAYIRTKPLHNSQIELNCKEDNDKIIEATFKLHLTPCFNFYQQLLSQRENIEVIKPLEVREEIKRIINTISKYYNNK